MRSEGWGRIMWGWFEQGGGGGVGVDRIGEGYIRHVGEFRYLHCKTFLYYIIITRNGVGLNVSSGG